MISLETCSILGTPVFFSGVREAKSSLLGSLSACQQDNFVQNYPSGI